MKDLASLMTSILEDSAEIGIRHTVLLVVGVDCMTDNKLTNKKTIGLLSYFHTRHIAYIFKPVELSMSRFLLL